MGFAINGTKNISNEILFSIAVIFDNIQEIIEKDINLPVIYAGKLSIHSLAILYSCADITMCHQE